VLQGEQPGRCTGCWQQINQVRALGTSGEATVGNALSEAGRTAGDGAQGDANGVTKCDALGDADRAALGGNLGDADEQSEVMCQVMQVAQPRVLP
jgi:hypothetical protein